MARRRAHLQNAFSKGELDPLLYGRTDLKHYYNALKTALNIEMLPQGGFRRRPGQASLGRLRRKIEPIVLTSGMLAAPNGGTAANLIDGTSSALVTGAAAGADFVVATVDLGAPKAVCFVDLVGFSAALVTGVMSVTMNTNATGAATIRVRIPAAAFSAGGDAVRLTLTPHTVTTQQIQDCFIGRAAAAPATDFASVPTRVTFNNGANGVSLPGGGGTVLSDIVPFSLDASGDHIVSFNLTGAGAYRHANAATDFITYSKGGEAQEAGQISVTGYGSDANRCAVVSEIEVGLAKQDALAVEYLDEGAATWEQFWPVPSGDPAAYRDISAAARARRFGLAPGSTETRQRWRVVVHNGAGAGAVTLQELRFWAEKGVKSAVDFLPFARSLAEAYAVPLTQDNVDIYRADAWVAAAGVTAPADIIELMGWMQSEDAGLLLHEDYQPARITRHGFDNEWNADFPAFSNVPRLSSPLSHSAFRFAEQRIEITGLVTSDVILFGIRNSFTGTITYSGGLSAGDIATAIEAAPNVDADGVVVTDLSTAGNALSFNVAFVNVNGAQHWPRLVPYVLGNNAAVAKVTVLQEGVSGSTPLMDTKTGWPRAGIVTQARLLLGGPKSFPKTLGMSQNGALFDFQLSKSLALATDARADRLETDQVETIRHIVVGTHIAIFTDSGEWYIENRTLSATDALNFVRATGNGCAASVPPIFADGGILFVQAGGDDEAAEPETQGSVLRNFMFGGDASQASYSAEPLSLLGPHLLTGIKAMAWRRARKTDEGGLVIMVNADGTLPVMTYLRAQEVVSLARHTTDGLYRAATVNVRRDVHFAVERAIGGAADNWLERREASRLLDASVVKTLSGTNVVTGLGHLEGKTNAWAIAGGNPYGPFTVTGGQIALPLPASFSGDVEVGLFFETKARTLPLRPQLPDDAKFKPPGRCYRLIVSVIDTGGFAVSANGAAPRTIVCRDPDAPLLDTPMMDALFTGDVVVEDLEGWTKDVEVEISQPTPAPLTVRSLRMEVAY